MSQNWQYPSKAEPVSQDAETVKVEQWMQEPQLPVLKAVALSVALLASGMTFVAEPSDFPSIPEIVAVENVMPVRTKVAFEHPSFFYVADLLVVTIPPAEGISGRMIHVKEVGGSSKTVTIRAKNGVHTVAQTIERLTEITIASADGGVLLMADGISNWMIVARVGT